MTPKDKAKELVDKMWNIDERYGSIGFHEAKQCALIAVDRIINNFGLLTEGKTHYSSSSTVKYYEQVKQEIKNI